MLNPFDQDLKLTNHNKRRKKQQQRNKQQRTNRIATKTELPLLLHQIACENGVSFLSSVTKRCKVKQSKRKFLSTLNWKSLQRNFKLIITYTLSTQWLTKEKQSPYRISSRANWCPQHLNIHLLNALLGYDIQYGVSLVAMERFLVNRCFQLAPRLPILSAKNKMKQNRISLFLASFLSDCSSSQKEGNVST